MLSEELAGPVGGDNIPLVEVVEVEETQDLHQPEADLGLAQYEGSDSGSCSSFEVLLPDFSSLGLSDVKQSDTSSTSTSDETARDKRSSTPEAGNISNR